MVAVMRCYPLLQVGSYALRYLPSRELILDNFCCPIFSLVDPIG